MSTILIAGALDAQTPPAAEWPNRVSAEDREYLQQIMKETWHSIDYYRSPATGLPYDSNQARDKTNTTNVGLYLSSLCMAHKLGFISKEDAVARATKILDSLEKYENWRGMYNNWLDPDGKELKAKPGENNISDYNKLPAGLIVVRQTFPELGERCTKFLDALPWESFYDTSSGKICYAFDVVEKKAYSPVYFFRGEDKLLGQFLMIASGKVPADTWEKRDAGTETRYGVTYYKYGWQGGGLFMHYICSLFLDMRGTPLGKSAINFAWAQLVNSSKVGSPVWGWSACVAPSDEYLGMDKIKDEVVTPHASALAISFFPEETIANFKRLDAFNLRKPMMVDGKPERFGFRDSVNWTNGSVADKYLVLDQTMLFLSLVNYCEDGLLWKTFGADATVQHGVKLIAEYRDAPQHRTEEQDYIRSLSWNEPGVFWVKPDAELSHVPGERITRTLWARSLSRNPLSGSTFQWSVTNSAGKQVLAGKADINLAPHQTQKLSDISISTDGAEYGKRWTLKSNLVGQDKTPLLAQEESFFFPGCTNLKGTWRIKAGDDMGWAATDFDDSQWAKANVPVRWEDDGLTDYDGFAWYRIAFEVSDDDLKRWGAKPLAIALGAIDDADETYLNGVKIGKTGAFPPNEQTAYNVPRIYSFDRATLQPKNTLAVRVSDWGGNGGIWRRPAVIGPVEDVKEAIQIAQ